MAEFQPRSSWLGTRSWVKRSRLYEAPRVQLLHFLHRTLVSANEGVKSVFHLPSGARFEILVF